MAATGADIMILLQALSVQYKFRSTFVKLWTIKNNNSNVDGDQTGPLTQSALVETGTFRRSIVALKRQGEEVTTAGFPACTDFTSTPNIPSRMPPSYRGYGPESTKFEKCTKEHTTKFNAIVDNGVSTLLPKLGAVKH